MSQQSFAELGVWNEVVRALAAGSITEPFKIQSIVLPDALAGLDVLAKSPTGSGKTLAFALRSSSAPSRRTRARARSSSYPRASSRSRSPTSSLRWPQPRA